MLFDITDGRYTISVKTNKSPQVGHVMCIRDDIKKVRVRVNQVDGCVCHVDNIDSDIGCLSLSDPLRAFLS